MTLRKPDKPARLRGMDGTLSINTRGTETDAYHAYAPTTTTTVAYVPCSLYVMSPAEAFKFGKDTDLTMYRVRCPVRHQDGTDIRLDHGQDVTVTSNEFPSGETFVVVGAGHPQGRSGIQHAVVRREGR